MEKTIRRPEHKHLLEVLRELRSAAGLSQTEVAKRLSEPQSFVSKYESGERRLDLIELRQVSEALGSSLPELIEMFEERSK